MMHLNHSRAFLLRSAVWAGLIFGSLSMIQPDVLKAAPAAVPAEASVMINVNEASAEELQQIRGIGPSLAERIIRYREEFGPFDEADDLANVRGIGGVKLQKIKKQIQL